MAEKQSPPVPEGAIKVGDDLYQVPVGTDAGGCMQYRMFSQTKAVVAAIFYRAPSGEFTMDRSRADCGTGSN